MQVVSRAEWGARPPKATSPRPLSEVSGWCWHHAGAFLAPDASFELECAFVRAAQGWCMDHHGYWDIDYEALIGPSGRIYQGRDVTVTEAAQSGTWNGRPANESLLGVCFLGDFTRQVLGMAAQQAALGLVWVTAVGFAQVHLAAPAKHITHNALVHEGGIGTVCPGASVRAFIVGPPFHGQVS